MEKNYKCFIHECPNTKSWKTKPSLLKHLNKHLWNSKSGLQNSFPSNWREIYDLEICDTCYTFLDASSGATRHRNCKAIRSTPPTIKIREIESSDDSLNDDIQPDLVNNNNLPDIRTLFQSRSRLLKHIPKTIRRPYSMILTELISKCNDMESYTKLCLFPYVTLYRTKSRGKKGISEILKRMNDFENEKYKELFETASIAFESKGKTSDVSKIKRAEYLTSNGNYTAAIHALTSTPPPLSEAEIILLLHKKHPPSSVDTNKIPPSRKMPPLEVEKVKRALMCFNQNTSYGPSNLTVRHLRQLIPTNESLLPALTTFINFLLSDKVPNDIKPYVFGARLIALGKENNDIRPIAVGNLERRIASKIISEHWRDPLLDTVQPCQIGIAQPSAMEYAVANTMLCKGEGDSVLLIDFENAFNSVDRDTILDWSYEKAPECYPYVLNSYGSPSFLFYNDEIIESQSGVQQGDPIGPDLFSAALSKVTKKLEDVNLSCNNFFLDDGILCGKPDDLLEALNIIVEAAKSINLKVKTSKCRFIPGSGVINLKPFIDLGVHVDSNFKLLGIPIGDDTFIKKFYMDKMEELESVCTNITSLDPHIAFTLLKYTQNYCKINHIARCLNPKSLSPLVWKNYDDIIRKALSSIISKDITDLAWEQAQLSTKYGGLGFRGTEYNKVSFIAASLSTGLFEEIDLLNDLKCVLQGQDLPKDITQRNCNKIKDKLQYVDFYDALSCPEDKSRINSISSKYSLSWLNAVPNQKLGLYLDSQQFCISIKLILGLPIFNGSKTCPTCQGINDSFGHHCLSCSVIRGNRIHKHNIIRDSIFRDMQRACLAPQKERNLTGGTRPGDIMLPLFRNSKDLYLDIAIINPLTDHALSNGSATDKGAHIKAYELLKQKRYENEFNHCSSAVFQPLILDCFGAWSDSSIDLFKTIAKGISNLSLDPYGTVLNNMFQKYSAVLYQVNSRQLALRLDD